MRHIQINLVCISKVFLLIFSFTVIVASLETPTHPCGESAEYMLTTTAIVNHFSMDITADDIAKAKVAFPEHAASFDNPNIIVISKDPIIYRAYYFGTYSFSAIPAKWFLKLLGFDQSYAFALTNALFLIIALSVVYFKLRASPKTKLVAILLLGLNPILFYLPWASAEVFIFSMVVISLVNYSNKNFRMAALFVSIAGTLNLTIMIFGAVIILHYFICLIRDKRNKTKNIFSDSLNICLHNVKDILILAACYIPCLIVIGYNFYFYGALVPMQNCSTTRYYFDRVFTYFFDLNLGFLPYYPVIMLIAAVLIVTAVVKRRFCSLLLPIAFIGTVMAYSLMQHINCGTTGIARYSAWAAPILLFFVISQTDELINRLNMKRVVWIGSCISVIYTSAIFYGYGGFKAYEGNVISYVSMTPVSRLVLDRFPALYNPFPYTFVSRVLHVDGGYSYTDPVYYISEDNTIKKILVTSDTADEVLKNVTGDPAVMESLTKQVDETKKSTGFHYINISGGSLYYAKAYTVGDTINFTSTNNTSESYLPSGFSVKEQDGTWTGADAEIRLSPAEGLQDGSTLEVRFGEFITVNGVNVYVNNALVGTVGKNSDVVTYDFKLPASYSSGEALDIVFKIDGASSPASFGSNDSRILGIKISSLRIKNS